MLATLHAGMLPAGEWLYEPKLDGVRCVAYRRNGHVEMYSRNRRSLRARYIEVAEALEAQPGVDFVIDGEIVAFDGERTSFEKLQARHGINDPTAARATGVDIYYYVFDLLFADGRDFRRVPIEQRKETLQSLLRFDDRIRYSSHRSGDGKAMFDAACSRGWEGLIAKAAGSVYTSGRSATWLKLKCVRQQEFVIGGYTDPQGARSGFGALLIGYHDANGALKFAGRVGTGFDERLLADLTKRLRKMQRAKSPFADAPRMRDAHWVEPELVCQVGFSEWTSAGSLRHPRFMGMRDDKKPHEVTREEPSS